jgi:uncharacterized protein (TIGR02596 family)
MNGSVACIPTPAAAAWTHRGRCCGFTLLEIVIVMAAVALLLTLGVSGFQGSMASQKLSTATVLLTNELARTSQVAVKENRTIHVRFLRRSEMEVEQYRGWIMLAANRTTGELEPLAEEQALPSGVVILNDGVFSNILQHVSVAGQDLHLGFTPEGGTTLSVAAGSRWCLTLVLETDLARNSSDPVGQAASTALPPNHRTLLVNAHTGAVTAY